MKKFFSFFISFIFASGLFAQQSLMLSKESKISISGSSTLHDWTAVVNDFEGSCIIDEALGDAPEKGKALSEIKLSFTSATIDGGRGPAMNGKIKKALKVDEHPQITFNAEEATITDVGGQGFTITTSGTLNIAGVDQTVEIKLEGKRNKDGLLQFTGSKALKMSDFNITPPSAMFGQIETKDDIVVNFELQFTTK